MSVRPILCVVGGSGSGKTTLLEGVIPRLREAGLRVGVIKGTHRALEVGPAGKDSSRLAAAGACPVIAAGLGSLTVQNAGGEVCLADLAEVFCAGCDLVLVEGHKHGPDDKVLVTPGSGALGTAGVPPAPGGHAGETPAVPGHAGETPAVPGEELSGVRLVVSGAERDDAAAVAGWIMDWLARRRRLGDGVAAAILAGGASRRMGADKALLRVRGRSVLADLAEMLAGRMDGVWVIGRAEPPPEAPRSVRVHLDLRAGCGPLGGVATALRLAGRAVLAVACDMPAFSGEAVDFLLDRRRAWPQGPTHPATAFRNAATGRLEPLAAVYEPEALPAIERALDAGEFSATRLLASLPAREIDAPPAIAAQLANVNTPEDLGRLQ